MDTTARWAPPTGSPASNPPVIRAVLPARSPEDCGGDGSAGTACGEGNGEPLVPDATAVCAASSSGIQMARSSTGHVCSRSISPCIPVAAAAKSARNASTRSMWEMTEDAGLDSAGQCSHLSVGLRRACPSHAHPGARASRRDDVGAIHRRVIGSPTLSCRDILWRMRCTCDHLTAHVYACAHTTIDITCATLTHPPPSVGAGERNTALFQGAKVLARKDEDHVTEITICRLCEEKVRLKQPGPGPNLVSQP